MNPTTHSCADCSRDCQGNVCFAPDGAERIVCTECMAINYGSDGHAIPVGYRSDINPAHLGSLMDHEAEPTAIQRCWGMQPSLLYVSFATPACGCRIVGNGTSQAPLAIAFCSRHR